jgi:hypothetical protein
MRRARRTNGGVRPATEMIHSILLSRPRDRGPGEFRGGSTVRVRPFKERERMKKQSSARRGVRA